MNKAMLLILDGWGIGNKDNSDAIAAANTPFIDGLHNSVPHSKLKTFGKHVGLPDGQMGNSEVGHMNIGAGRIVWQMLVRINNAFENNKVENTDAFKRIVAEAEDNPTAKIHLNGLVSDGGVHSSLDHLLELTALFKKYNLDNRVFIHAFTDGRDTDPKSGLGFIKHVLESSKLGSATLATICGRYYAMDRDKRWERTKLAYDALVFAKGNKFGNAQGAINASYEAGITDEFIEPIVLTDDGHIEKDDIVVGFNFRTDRGRQITSALSQVDYLDHGMKSLPIKMFTFTEYDKRFEGVDVFFPNQDLVNTMGEVLAQNKLTQLRAAETEKYPHVTFFFNGGREEEFEGEKRVMANSPKVATYDLQPEMSAFELTDKVVEQINSETPDFICLNYANPDMVGHTGVFSAIVKACETVDGCAKTVVEAAKANNYQIIIIADHGNADMAINPDGSPNTAHTTNLVPCYLVNSDYKEILDGKLADIAPSLLTLMNVAIPKEMTGEILVKK